MVSNEEDLLLSTVYIPVSGSSTTFPSAAVGTDHRGVTCCEQKGSRIGKRSVHPDTGTTQDMKTVSATPRRVAR